MSTVDVQRNVLFVFTSPQHLLQLTDVILNKKPSLVVFDECHYVSVFGSAFRPEFALLGPNFLYLISQ